MTKERWPYWDVLVFAAGVVPLVLAIFVGAFGTRGEAFFMFAGSVGTLVWLTVWACVPLVLAGTVMGWRTGNRLLIVAGIVFLATSMAPVLLLVAVCTFGSCI